jgi:chitinase
MIIRIILLIMLLASPAYAAVLYETNFDSSADWTVVQPMPPETQCYPPTNCGMPSPWNSYKNGSNRCGSGVSGRPGSNLWYIDTGAGYSDAYSTTPTACASGTKCATYWMESCVDGFEDSDGSITIIMNSEQPDLYVRWKIKFKPNFELMSSDWQNKLFHIQHSVDGSNPYSYFSGSGDNVPVTVGGLASYSDNYLYFYAENRCYGPTYACNGVVNWGLGTIASQRNAGGLLDGNWHTIEYRATMNTIVGTCNGSVNLYIDGVLKSVIPGYPNTGLCFSQTGMRGWKSVLIGGNSDIQWDLSSSTMESREQWYAVDDVVISTTYIGPDYVIGGSDTTAPTVSGAYPSSNQNCTPHRNAITVGLSTDENATCRYSTMDIAYDSMSLTMSGSGTLAHSFSIAPKCDTTYDYYVRCSDSSGNKNTSSEHISFYVTPQYWRRGHNVEIR